MASTHESGAAVSSRFNRLSVSALSTGVVWVRVVWRR
jgi:hypothetical protein